jgi:hypothetical protein
MPASNKLEHYADAQPGAGIDTADADPDGCGEVGQAQGHCDQQERDHREPYDENEAPKVKLPGWAFSHPRRAACGELR